MTGGSLQSRDMSHSESPHVVELYVRSLAAGDSQARVEETLSRLRDLESDGAIDDYDVHVWGDGVALDSQVTETDAGAFIRERVAAFREWAHEADRDLAGFDERTTHSAMTGRAHRNLSVPAMALCERRGEDIEWVAPCEDDGTVTVGDRLDALEEETVSDPEVVAAPPAND